jgi:hypothetical protein
VTEAISSYGARSLPAPRPVAGPAVWDLVLTDIRERDAAGQAKYGQPLRPFNGRDALADLYQELLDAVVYVRQVIYERDTARDATDAAAVTAAVAAPAPEAGRPEGSIVDRRSCEPQLVEKSILPDSP